MFISMTRLQLVLMLMAGDVASLLGPVKLVVDRQE